MKKTNAMRILDGLGISYETAEYEDDGEHELAKGAALRLSEKLGVAPETVFKTIVMRTETKEICVFCQSAESEINLFVIARRLRRSNLLNDELALFC